MSSLSNIPNPIGNDPIQVVERTVREVPCPNPECDHKLDITSINYGTKIKCQNCDNITWTPTYEEQWWQKTKGFVLSIILSLLIGVAGSIGGSAVWESYNAEAAQEQAEQPEEGG
ncbi:hypothetical protein [Psychrosphaera haliotis]|uniref:Uncharacterized protein n=1 Tax=Psychrosphaera haliotis TaxID=555083 RepID=A0A6N8FAK3_9GAMM|nr:hypothetical protein [Psychrosphaera haliotis]MUH72000.1 hypothetical protein [Psychrosphaera haliotis]